MRRRFRSVAALLALFALLFAQLATAAYACPQLADRSEVVVSMPDCDHDASVTPNLCERHCDYGKASLDSPKPLPLPAIATDFVRAVAVVSVTQPTRAEPRARIATGPPATRFTVLRI